MLLEALQQSVTSLLTTINKPLTHQLLNLNLLLNTLSQTPLKSKTPNIQTLHSPYSCPSPSLSCPLTTPFTLDTCCINSPSGHFLLAQFWDTSPPLGPIDSWTLHGLWPDLCTGGFDVFCNDSRNLALAEINAIVDSASSRGASGDRYGSLRTYMDTYWKGLNGDDVLWMHEWNKHGTCVSTLEPQCYDQPESTSSTDGNLDVVDYFTAATSLHSTLQTHAVLSSQSIVPSYTQTYTLSAIQAALSSAHGFPGTVKCNYRGELNEIWLHYLIAGPSLRNYTIGSESDTFIPVPPDGLVSNCPARGIKYLPKQDGVGTPKPKPDPKPIPRRPFEGRGYLKAHVVEAGDGAAFMDESGILAVQSTASLEGEGCLIRRGEWYTSGTCATYHTKTDVYDNAADHGGDDGSNTSRLFTLSSSAGPCAVLEVDGTHGVAGEFVCAKDLPVQSIFGSVSIDGYDVLSWKGETAFFADQKPEKYQKVKVFGGERNMERSVKLELYWESI